MLDLDYLRSRLDYEPNTGLFRWKAKVGTDRLTAAWNGRYSNRAAGTLNSHGYIQISLDGRLHMAQRLAWLLMTGCMPPDEIDHINRARSDNRFANLRLADRSENAVNRDIYCPSGFRGVSRKGGRWRARIQKDGIATQVGTFDTPEEAYAAYREAAERLHGSFAFQRRELDLMSNTGVPIRPPVGDEFPENRSLR